jgi:aarF domain-containing kinase
MDTTPSAVAFFTPVILARAARCDACDAELASGASVRLVGGARARPSWRFRCVACATSGRGAEPRDDAGATAIVPWVLAPPLAETIEPLARRVGPAIAVGRRVLETAAVALRTVFAWVRGKLRRDENVAPVVVRGAFERLGTTYIKLGQLVASSQGLFPEPYCRELQKCLDRVPAFPADDALAIVEAELGEPAGALFRDFDREPLAAASIAQVHAARLRDGTDVVVKVQRPGLSPILAADLSILRGVAHVLERLPHGAMANPVGIVEDFAANLAEEVDFAREAANMAEFNRIMAAHDHDDVVAPRAVPGLVRKRVLVMERFFGHRVDDVERIRARGIDGEAKLLSGMRAWFRCLVLHGFFHGDVHAGNLMALDDGRIGFLDFGIVGRFSDERRAQVTDYLLAFAAADFRRVADVMVAMGSAPRSVDREALATDLERQWGPLVGGAVESPKYAELIPGIVATAVAHGLRLPRDLVLVMKQMLYFDRYAKTLAPKLNVFRDPRVVAALAEDVLAARALH